MNPWLEIILPYFNYSKIQLKKPKVGMSTDKLYKEK